MPRPRRRTPRKLKRPPTESELVTMWSTVFTSGCDFFNELEAVGHGGMHPDYDAHAMVAAGEAWSRFGSVFMASWAPSPRHHQMPWAQERFGLPLPVHTATETRIAK